ncbi:MAG: hypothetical protein H5U07_00485 [Candidatus Aminicenantes bacterium]|nr:hypothetical protein [Candidatus Aminicenantes bacterium]
MKHKNKILAIQFFKISWLFIFLLFLLPNNAELNASGQWVTLSISPSSISFQAGDPDLMPKVSANSPVLVSIQLPQSRRWRLYIRAEGNLVGDQGQVISISNVSWVASPKPQLVDGVLMAGQSLELGQGRGRLLNGQLEFYFNNNWSYVAGTYTQVVTFTVMII